MALRGHALKGLQNPFIRCAECRNRVVYLHTNTSCPCGEEYLSNHPCGCEAEVYSICSTWTAHGGCQCIDQEKHD